MRIIQNTNQLKTNIIITRIDSDGVGIGSSTTIRPGQIVKFLGKGDNGTIRVSIKGKDYKCFLNRRFRLPYKNELNLKPE